MDDDRRKGEDPVPDNLEELLNEMQLMALRQIESFGWQLTFVRKPLFQDVVPVVLNAEGDKIGILEEDGRVNVQPDIKVRQ